MGPRAWNTSASRRVPRVLEWAFAVHVPAFFALCRSLYSCVGDFILSFFITTLFHCACADCAGWDCWRGLCWRRCQPGRLLPCASGLQRYQASQNVCPSLWIIIFDDKKFPLIESKSGERGKGKCRHISWSFLCVRHFSIFFVFYTITVEQRRALYRFS